jgi:glycosyltransferase involved in cell wall biosynthesis
MKISVVIAILNSHEIVRRQILHFSSMNLSDEVEFIFVDDGSTPPLTGSMRNLKFLYTNDKRPWTQGLARNLGAKSALGDFIIFTDIDHIITREAIDSVLSFTGDKLVFLRLYGLIKEDGTLTQDVSELIEFGLDPARLRGRNRNGGFHGNTYAIRRTVFETMGGYNPSLCQYMFHAGGKKVQSEDRNFNLRYDRRSTRGLIKPTDVGPPILFFPTGRFNIYGNNPHGLFHQLSLEQTPQPMLP